MPSRSRKVTIAVIFVLAFITGFLAITATWAKRQVLDSGNWTDTSSKLLADQEIRNQLGAYLVSELFKASDVRNELQGVLPQQTQALAAPAAAGLQSLALQLAPKLLERPRVQDAWRKSNEVAHEQLINVIEGGGDNVSTANGEVTLNLRNIVDELAANLGVQDKVAAARAKLNLPPDSGKLVIMKSDQLKAAQDYTNALRSLSIILTIVSFGLFALAVYLARDARRVVFRAVGWSFFALGLLTLLFRRAGGSAVVDGLVQAESVKPAAHNAWAIATSLLYDIGVAFVIYGLIFVFCAWLVGPMSYAVRLREHLAPTLANKPGTVYAAVGGLYLLVLAWGPTPAFRQFLPILLIGCLIVAGVEVLRRQTAREFPTATPAIA